MKKIPLLYLVSKNLNFGKHSFSPWHKIGSSTLLETVIKKLKTIELVNEIWLVSDEDEVRQLAEKQGLKFFPFSEPKNNTVYDWASANSSCFVLFYALTPFFDSDILTKAIVDHQSYDIGGYYQNFIVCNYQNFLSSRRDFSDKGDEIQKYRSTGIWIDKQLDQFHPLNDSIFDPFVYLLNIQSTSSLNKKGLIPDYVRKDQFSEVVNFPYAPSYYHVDILDEIAGDPPFFEGLKNSDLKQLRNYSIQRLKMTCPEKNKLHLVRDCAVRIVKSSSLFKAKNDSGVTLEYDKLSLEDLIQINASVKTESQTAVFLKELVMTEGSDITALFKEPSIDAVVFEYSNHCEWEKKLSSFLDARRIICTEMGLADNWKPKVCIRFDVDKYDEKQFDDFSRKWYFKRIILDKYKRNLQLNEYWRAFYSMVSPLPEYIIRKKANVSFFDRRFPCRHLSTINVNSNGEVFLCPEYNEVLLGTLDDIEKGNVIKMIGNHKRIEILEKHDEKSFEDLKCRTCNCWMDPF